MKTKKQTVKKAEQAKEHKMNNTLTKTSKTNSERLLAYQFEQVNQLWLDMDEFPIELDNTEEVAKALRAAEADPTDKDKLKALAEALNDLENEMYDNLRVTPQDCCNLAFGLEKLCK